MSLTIQGNKTLKLAYPIIFGELAQIALQLIDTAMVGAVSYKHLAAAALVGSVMTIPFVMGIGLTIAVSQLVSQANGQRDSQLVSHYLFNGFWLSAIAAVIISLGLELGKNVLFHLNQDPEVALLAVPYLRLVGWSIIPMLLFIALKQFTDGLEFTKTAMILSVAALPLNFFFNWVLIFGNLGFPRLELVGAGWGTLLTRIIIFVILGIVVLKHSTFNKYIAVRKKQWVLKWATIKELLHIGIPTSMQISMEAGAFAVSGILVGTIGAVEQAAHQIALTLASVTFMAMMGFSQAASIRTSNAFGRKNWPLINLIGRSTMIIALGYGIVCALVFIILKNQLPYIFNDNYEVVTLSALLLFYAGIFQISDSIQAVSAGLLRGIKDVRVPTLFIFIAYWIVGLPIGCLLAFTYDWGAVGIWIGFIVGLTVSAIFLSLRVRKLTSANRNSLISE